MRRRHIHFSDEARKQLRAIEQAVAYEILRKLDRYSVTGVGDIKKLTGIDPPELRMRVGRYRIRFYSRLNSIDVISVTDRSIAYRSL